MDRAADLRAAYDLLWRKLEEADGSGASNIARELRLIGAELERIEAPEEVSRVDELARKRAASGSGRPPARRKSG